MDLPADALVRAEQSSRTECLSIKRAASPLENHLGLSEKGTFKGYKKPYQGPDHRVGPDVVVCTLVSRQ